MGVTGSDANKRYEDNLYDAVQKSVIDANQESYSSTFFKSQTGNKVFQDIADLMLTSGIYSGVQYLPQSGSPLLGAASFTDGLLSSWFEKVSYIGAFGNNDNWLRGWTEFDPQNAECVYGLSFMEMSIHLYSFIYAYAKQITKGNHT